MNFSYHVDEIRIITNSDPIIEKLKSRSFPSVNPMLDKNKKQWSTFGRPAFLSAYWKSNISELSGNMYSNHKGVNKESQGISSKSHCNLLKSDKSIVNIKIKKDIFINVF